jgi:predicted permease
MRPNRRDRDLEEELRLHLELAAEDVHRTIPSAHPARAAVLRVGGVSQAMEALRDQRGVPFLDVLWQDVQYAARLLMKDRGFTLAAVSVLALGIAANATMFTAVNAALLRDLPFDAPEQIVSLGTRDTRARFVPGPPGYRGVSWPEFQDWKTATGSFSGIAAYFQTAMNVGDDEHAPERLVGAYVSAGLFRLLGRQPQLGRDFSESDDRPGTNAVVILGHRIWRTRYNADPAALGRVIRVNGVRSTVIGVMAEGFEFPLNAELWQPLHAHPTISAPTRTIRLLDLVGRLADGATLAQGHAELDAIAARLAREHPETNLSISPTITPYADRHVAPQVKAIFLALMAAVGLVLLIACANVANLLLGRSAARAGEMSIRVSLGATRWRVIRQLLVESVLLAVLAGAIGLALSVTGIRLFEVILGGLGGPLPYWIRFTMDARVLAFVTALCLGTAVLFGLAPAMHISRADANLSLKQTVRIGPTSARARRVTGALVAGQLALTLVLLAAAGFIGRSFLDLYRIDLGFETSGLIRMGLELPPVRYPTPETRAAFARELDARLGTLPGTAASVANAPPFGGGDTYQLVMGGPQPDAGPPPDVSVRTVGPDFFRTLGLSLMRGRPFTESDGAVGQEVAIVNERFVTMFFPDADPLGARIGLTHARFTDGVLRRIRIVGIAPNVYQRNANAPEAVVYLPFLAQQLHWFNLYVFVRGHADTAALVATVRETVRTVDADLPVFDVSTFDEWLAFFRSPERVFSTLFGMFAGMALLLSAMGLYAVVAQSVALRTQEIGLRMALGARGGQVRWLVIRRGLLYLGVGLTLGLGGALGVGRLLAGLWATGNDPATLVVVIALLITVALAACYAPARRASSVDPAITLRAE